MDFAEKLKEIRKNEGLSQEQLSEKIGVSRQAITKWETGKGLPDIENLVILAEIFKTSIDELVSQEISSQKENTAMYCSENIYDMDEMTQINLELLRAKEIHISSNDSEKLYIKLESDCIEDLTSFIKMKILDAGKRMDVKCRKNKEISENDMEQSLIVTILVPAKYCNHCEVSGFTNQLIINNLHIEELEYDGRADYVKIEKSSGNIALAGTTDYDICIDAIQGILEVAQIKANTRIEFSESTDFALTSRKRKVQAYWKIDEKECEPFDSCDSENKLVYNGTKSEIMIVKKEA